MGIMCKLHLEDGTRAAIWDVRHGLAPDGA
jgi:hypothetical protein